MEGYYYIFWGVYRISIIRILIQIQYTISYNCRFKITSFNIISSLRVYFVPYLFGQLPMKLLGNIPSYILYEFYTVRIMTLYIYGQV